MSIDFHHLDNRFEGNRRKVYYLKKLTTSFNTIDKIAIPTNISKDRKTVQAFYKSNSFFKFDWRYFQQITFIPWSVLSLITSIKTLINITSFLGESVSIRTFQYFRSLLN